MKLHSYRCIDSTPPHLLPRRRISPAPTPTGLCSPARLHVSRRMRSSSGYGRVVVCVQNRRITGESEEFIAGRRGIVLLPILAAGVSMLRSKVASAGEEKPPEVPVAVVDPPAEKVEEVAARIYDATVIGEPLAVGKDKSKVWEKMMNARIVYLGEAEQVPIRDDKELELEIVKNLRKRSLESNRSISLALEAFPCDIQEQLNQFMDGGIDVETLKSYTPHWTPERWQEYSPILSYCRDNGVQVVACGTPLEVLRTVQAEGIRGLSKSDRAKYSPPAGSGFISGFSAISRRLSTEQSILNDSFTFGPISYLSVQARAVEDYTMSQVIQQAVADGGASGLLVVVTGASHVMYGPRGKGVPARISRKMQKKNQVVILLDPERQFIRREGEVPIADFLWYSAARPCSRNCFDRAEIARIMNAAGRRRDALPQDLQKGLDLGLVSPEVLQNFFDLEQYPMLSELTHRFQGFRERLLADPKFLHKLAIEEAISITTTLLAQFEKRKENFFQELDYVVTDTLRGAVVDFFTVWLPAPTLSFLSFGDEMDMADSMDSLKGLLGSIPDNAFQKSPVGKNWNLTHRVASLLVGGLKLSGVGFISSIGAVAASNVIYALRKFLNPTLVTNQKYKRSPIVKTAVVYSFFLGTSANLRYQVIAGLVEHRISEYLPAPLLVNMLSFCSRTINSYWGTQQWIDLARYTGLQTRNAEASTTEASDLPNPSAIECSSTDDSNVNDIKNQ